MKKLLLFAMGAMMAMPIVAQEEDVTNLIANAGFDEDLTFQVDGSMKEIESTTTSLSERSWAYIATDKTVYAKPKETSSQQRTDGRSKLDAVNGFHGQVKGWELTRVTFPKCEWMYFGVVPYGLPTDAVPIADDGSGYLLVPEKPEGFTGDDNKGMLYMRAGWTNACSYKQVVQLPCAEYRLEYWTINVNPNSTATAEDLTNINCRGEIFKDEEGTGLSSTTWVKHEFVFTPTAEFTMEFGYKSANSTSNNNPWVCLDGIKLYKIGEADRAELLQADLLALEDSLASASNDAASVGLNALASKLTDLVSEIDLVVGGDEETMWQMYTSTQPLLAEVKKAIAAAPELAAAIAKLEALAASTNYPGKSDLEAAITRIKGYQNDETSDLTVAQLVEKILNVNEETSAVILAYMMTQEASQDNPADYTMLIQSPWFAKEGFAPTSENDPEFDASTFDTANLNSTGWYKSGNGGGDQTVKLCQSLPCWNAWATDHTTLSVSQDFENLPNGYYYVSALIITQQDWANQTQHVFAKSSLGSFDSEPLNEGNWDASDNALGQGQWTRLETKPALVTDGKLTIGAAGTSTQSGTQSGWFCVTGFKLYYMGEAGSDAVEQLLAQRKDEAAAFASTMHFAADKAALEQAINAGGEATEALIALTTALEEAKTSEAKYEEYMQEGKTLPTVEQTLSGAGYEAATEIVKFAYDYVMNWLGSSEATYKEMDNQVNLLKNYLNNYAPVYNQAAKMAETATGTGKTALEETMAQQKAQLTSEMQTAEVVNQLIDALKVKMTNVEKQIIWETEGATDYTAFIINPMLQSESGWTFDKGNGNNNTNAGQWFNGDASVRYIDSYKSENVTDQTTGETTHVGLQNFIATQLVTGLPNGNYVVGVYTRTTTEGSYIFWAEGADAQKQFVEIPMEYWINDEGVEAAATDTHGSVWAAANEAYMAGSEDPDIAAIANCNGGAGRGWRHQEMAVTVNNHQLLIGTATGNTETLGTEKTFTGDWYSVGGWTLTLQQKGDNTGWEGPMADGIENIVLGEKAADGIYSLNGVKMRSLQRGLNIIVSDGKAVKVMVK